MHTLKKIPTNVITGFLGVGKSTAILNLLKHKPDNERWAVLVNEFGEVGIDGSLLSGQRSEQTGIFIREVPGGCMCCAAGLPMQIALNMLLGRAKPDRLLIEPTGLGHPQEVLNTLSAKHYHEVLDLHATLTLVDARKVQEDRYKNHATFNQQLAIADIIVANKADQYQSGDFPALLDFLEQNEMLANTSVYQVSHSALHIDWLDKPSGFQSNPQVVHHSDSANAETFAVLQAPELPEASYLCIDNQGEGFYSRGWIFKADWIFAADKLNSLLLGVKAERIKAVFITEKGMVAFNKADNVLTETLLDDCVDSRIECITTEKNSLDSLQEKLLDCVTNR